MPVAYPLSPMQGGMLYQYLLSDGTPERAGFDIEQVHISLEQQLDAALLARAWTEVVRRHPILSNRFRWKELPRPEQRREPNVRVAVTTLDWSTGEVAEQRRLFLAADRQRGFDLKVAPLMRVALANVDAGRSELIWTFHHIIADGRSFARILHEVFTVYTALQAGRVPDLPVLKLTYADYIAWLYKRDNQASIEFFKRLLAGKHSPTPLPLARPVSRLATDIGYASVNQVLSSEVVAQLASLAQRHHTTMGSLIQVAWGLLLSRLTGDEDVVFGITRSCRYSALGGAAESMVGLLINTLPARIKIDNDATIGELLTTTRQQWVAQRNHDQTPLVDVQSQSEFGPGVPLFETLLMYDNRELNHVLRQLDPAWTARHCQVHEQPSTPLTLIASDADVLELSLLYDRRRFTRQSAESMGAYLRTALTSLATAERVGDVEVLPAEERERIVYGWNDTVRPFSADTLIHQLFEAQVPQRPDAIAVEWLEQRLTFAQLEAQANQLAHVLRAHGARAGTYVGICLPRGLDLVVALLGVAKSGAAYVPVDTDYPTERMAYMLENAGTTLVIAEADFNLPGMAVISPTSAEVQSASLLRPHAQAQASDECYTIFTSGSTGKPKGVVLTHRAVINTLEWISRTFNVGPGDRSLFVTSPCFDLSVYDVFGVLGAGGTVVVASTECLREPRQMLRQLLTNDISIWNSAPATLQRLSSLFPDQGGTRLRLVMLSGDWIPLSLPAEVRRSFPAAAVISLGGATEAAIWSNWFPINGINPAWTSIPYGMPIQNAQYYVLDKRRRPVPVGVVGDLYIAGACLAEGYLKQPELTAERFVPNPFVPGARMYATGDLARYFNDGNLEFLGRADFQVKIRGYRIELGEIEAALHAIEGIREALCSAFVDVSGAKALVAHLTVHNGAKISAIDVQQKLRRTLPDFMVPAHVMILKALPLSANGKVDRNALPSPHSEQIATDVILPRTEAEQRMAKIWRKLLRRKVIAVDDSFFALGGDSLLAVSLVVEIEREFSIDFPLVRVLEHPTLETLTASLQDAVVGGNHLVTLNEKGKGVPLVLFCGVGGFGFFFHDLAEKLGPDQIVHVIHAVGATDHSERVDHSIEELVSIYAPQIEAVCKEGPIVVGGYSFGALIAFEVVRRLRRRGRIVPLVISFDGPAPGHPQPLPFFERQLTHLANWWHLKGAKRRQYFRHRLARTKRKLLRQEEEMAAELYNLEPAIKSRLYKVASGLWRARDRYSPKEPVRVDLLLLQSEVPLDWAGCRTDAQYGWSNFITGDISIVRVPGAHLQLFGPHNNRLMAQAITERMLKLP